MAQFVLNSGMNEYDLRPHEKSLAPAGGRRAQPPWASFFLVLSFLKCVMTVIAPVFQD